MQLNVLDDPAEAMKALDGKNQYTEIFVQDLWLVPNPHMQCER